MADFGKRRPSADEGDITTTMEPLDTLGYGHPAHRPDPQATYHFEQPEPRTLPLSKQPVLDVRLPISKLSVDFEGEQGADR